MNLWTAVDLAALKSLRARFLDGTAGHRDYWRTEQELALYNSTFGERIGWKWDAVLAELAVRQWQPRSSRVLDWGCGTGIASRRVLTQWPHLQALVLHDRSLKARRYAAEQVRAMFPAVQLQESTEITSDTLVVLSHVLNELPAAELTTLVTSLRQAGEIIWVEAGTHADSRRLIEAVREELRPQFHAVAPCTHQAQCGLLDPKNAPHWCHHFAQPPAAIFQDSRWSEFGRELGIDLRALPYSFLVLEREVTVPFPPGCSRVLGRPREAKGFTKILSCQAEGVEDLMLQKRDDAELFRAFHKGTAPALNRWQMDKGRIIGTEPI